MRIFTFLILSIFPLLSNCQTIDRNFFGIDLESDWYSLTNQQSLAYWIQDEDKTSNFVITDCSYISDKIDSKFLSLGFKELLLIFPKGYKGRLDSLKPEMFLSRISYSDIAEYSSNSINDMRNTLLFLKEKYGDPELNMIKEKYSVYKWKGVYYELILTCRQDELTTTIVYTKI